MHDFAQNSHTALECYQAQSKVPMDTNKHLESH